jgi:hypothetical protein
MRASKISAGYSKRKAPRFFIEAPFACPFLCCEATTPTQSRRVAHSSHFFPLSGRRIYLETDSSEGDWAFSPSVFTWE